jgi:dihydroorotate dehydrogenase (NAD+) catalytic subunit
VKTSVDLCGVRLKNPVIAASGTFAFGREYARFYPLSELGGISVKGLTLQPRAGNPSPRIAETPSGMLNAVGLQNPGAEAFLRDELPWLREQGVAVIANIAGSTQEDYVAMARKMSVEGVDIVELNISCPNVKEGGVAFGTSPEQVLAIVKAVRPACGKPLMVKLSPNVASIADCARAAEAGGADCLSLINTLTGMAIDVETRRPILGNITGGLSGPAVRPVALRMAYEAARAVRIPIVGCGGIETGEDAVMFLLAGCCAVQVGSANLYDPHACVNVARGIEAYMERHGIEAVGELVGGLIVPNER